MYNRLLHRLLSIQFIPNYHNLPIVEHLDENSLNYSLNNLKWSTKSANTRRAFTSGRMVTPNKGKFGKKHPRSKKVKQLDLNCVLVKIWDSMADIKRELGYKVPNISACCRGTVEKSYGFKWKYL